MSLRERIARCQDELESWRPDAQVGELFGNTDPSAEPLGAAVLLDDLRQELKRKKFMHLAVEAQLRFINGCQSSDLSALEAGQRGRSLEVARREAKERNQALKRDVARESAEHARLYEELADAYQQATRWHQQCDSELHELARLVEEAAADDEGDDPLQHPALSEWDGPLRDAAEEAEQTVERAADVLSRQPDELAKRRRLEYERRAIDRQHRAPEELRAEMSRLEARELAEIERLEHLDRLEIELGLPRIDLDFDRGIITLGGPVEDGPDDLDIRTVKVEFDCTGRLVRADIHPSLRLWAESSASADYDDLPRLLTLVWDRVCQLRGEGRCGSGQPVLGGA